MSQRFRSRYRDSVHYRERQDWAVEKNGPLVTAPAYPAQLHELLGQPYCTSCESWECECRCEECGTKTQALGEGLCSDCRDARVRHISPEQVERMEVG
jgi:hypothetical protein